MSHPNAKLKERRVHATTVFAVSIYEEEPFRWVECSCGWCSRRFKKAATASRHMDAHFDAHTRAAA